MPGTDRIASVGRWNNVGIKEEGEQFDDRIEIEEHDNLLASYAHGQRELTPTV